MPPEEEEEPRQLGGDQAGSDRGLLSQGISPLFLTCIHFKKKTDISTLSLGELFAENMARKEKHPRAHCHTNKEECHSLPCLAWGLSKRKTFWHGGSWLYERRHLCPCEKGRKEHPAYAQNWRREELHSFSGEELHCAPASLLS